MAQTMNVKDYVWVYNLLKPDFCDEILTSLKNTKWKEWEWYTLYGNVNSNDVKRRDHLDEVNKKTIPELEICMIDTLIMDRILPILVRATTQYTYRFNPPIKGTIAQIANQFSLVRIHKYNEGASMARHIDHSSTTSHPILTVVGILNDESEYEGGQFIMFDDYEVKLKKGDVVIFPSNFMFPHEVKIVTKGVRYSFTTWAS